MPSEQSILKMPIPPSRTKKYKRGSLHHVNMILNHQEMDILEEKEMAKN